MSHTIKIGASKEYLAKLKTTSDKEANSVKVGSRYYHMRTAFIVLHVFECITLGYLIWRVW